MFDVEILGKKDILFLILFHEKNLYMFHIPIFPKHIVACSIQS